jgi:hypothetical protein
MSCWKLSYNEQTCKQPAQSTTKKHNYSHMPRSQSAVRDAYLALEVGLKINEQKTKYMIAAQNDWTIRAVGKASQSATNIFKSSKNLCT